MQRKRENYLTRAFTYALIGLASYSTSGCTSNPKAVEETARALSASPREFIPKKVNLPAELEIYERGPIITENSDASLLSYPIRHRDASKLVDSVKQIFPDCIVIPELPTNQLLVRVPRQPNQALPQNNPRLEEVKKFIYGLDIKASQYAVNSYVMQVSAKKLDRVRASLDILAKSGNAGIALSSTYVDKGPQDRGISHTLTGLLDSLEVRTLFEGLQHIGVVTNFSAVSTTAQEKETALFKDQLKTPLEKIYPLPTQVPIKGYEYMEVPPSGVKVVTHARADGMVELELEVLQSNLLPAILNTQAQIPLFDIASRTTQSRLQVPLGGLLLLTSTLNHKSTQVEEGSPASRILGSNTVDEEDRKYELTAIMVNRVDPKQPAVGWAADELERRLDNK